MDEFFNSNFNPDLNLSNQYMGQSQDQEEKIQQNIIQQEELLGKESSNIEKPEEPKYDFEQEKLLEKEQDEKMIEEQYFNHEEQIPQNIPQEEQNLIEPNLDQIQMDSNINQNQIDSNSNRIQIDSNDQNEQNKIESNFNQIQIDSNVQNEQNEIEPNFDQIQIDSNVQNEHNEIEPNLDEIQMDSNINQNQIDSNSNRIQIDSNVQNEQNEIEPNFDQIQIDSNLKEKQIESLVENGNENIEANNKFDQIDNVYDRENTKGQNEESQFVEETKLFSDVRYYTINAKSSNIEQLLDENGASKESYLTTFITHVIYDKSEEDPNSNPDYSEAREVFDLPIVTSDWVEICVKTNSILPLEPYLVGNGNRLFSNIKLLNVNLPDDIAKKIYALISFYGGELINCDNFESIGQKATHGVSIEFDSKSEILDKNLKLVTPDWIIDCISNNKIQEELIYNPKYLKTRSLTEEKENEEQTLTEETQIEINQIQSQEILKENIEENVLAPSKSITLFTNSSDKNQFLQSQNINLNNQENQNSNEQNILTKTESLNINDQGSVSDQDKQVVIQKQVYVPGFGITVEVSQNDSSQAQESTTTQKSITPKKVSAKKKNSPESILKPNYSLNDSMNEIFDSVINKQNNAEKRENETYGLNTNGLLPIHVDLIRPVENSFSLNFDLDNDNDQNNLGEPYKTELNESKECNSNLLSNCVFYFKSNEEIYAKECLEDWEKVITKFGGKVYNQINIDDQNVFSQITHVICPNRFTKCYKKAVEYKKKVCTIYWLEDVLQEQIYRAPWLVYHFPSPYELKNGPLLNHVISSHGFNSKEKLFLYHVIWLLNGKYTPYLTYANSFLISKNMKGLKVDKAKKWNIPIVNANWLMELYLGNTYALAKPIEERYKNIPNSETYNHFAFDPSFVQDFMKLWINDLPLEATLPFKSASSNVKYSTKRQNEENNGIESSNKMVKVSMTSISWQKSQTTVPYVMFTGIEPMKVAQLQRDVIGLGGVIAKQPSQTTHLVVDKIERTAKLLKCISTCENIVTVKWIIDSKLNGKFMDPIEYQVKDENFEKHYNCCIKESLERAKTRRPLFNGLIFYLSPSVKPSYQDLVDMIKSAGGNVTNDIPTLQMINEPFRDESRTNLKSKYIIVGSQADLCILKPFIEKKIRKLLKFNCKKINEFSVYSIKAIYSEEIVLSGVLIQQVDANLYKFNVLQ